MIRFARDFRLIPIVLLATVCLFALKVSGLVFDGGYTLAERHARSRQDRHASHHAPRACRTIPRSSSPTSSRAARCGVAPGLEQVLGAGNVQLRRRQQRRHHRLGRRQRGKAEPRPALKTSEKPPDPTKLEVGGTAYPLEPGKINSAGERAVLERLQDRRKELDTRGRELEMRENLLKAAEKRVEAKVAELKDVEARVNTAMGNSRQAEDAQRFKSIVTMYENMKAKDAARIFDRLDMKILVEVATQIKPAKMSEILAQMTSEGAERLTVELANRASATRNRRIRTNCRRSKASRAAAERMIYAPANPHG